MNIVQIQPRFIPTACPKPALMQPTTTFRSQDEEREWSGASFKGEGQALIGLKWVCLGGTTSTTSFHHTKTDRFNFILYKIQFLFYNYPIEYLINSVLPN